MHHPELEVQTPHPHCEPSESDTLGMGSGFCVFISPPWEGVAYLSVGTTVPGKGPADPDSGSHRAASYSLI